MSIREVEKRLRQRKNKKNRQVDETPFSMRFSNIFEKEHKLEEKNEKFKKLEKKLKELGDEPVQLSMTQFQRHEQHLLEKLSEISQVKLLSASPQSEEAKMVACEREGLHLLDGLFLEVYQPFLKVGLKEKQIKDVKSSSKLDVANSKMNVYLQSNVPKKDKFPEERQVCFLNNQTKFLPSFDSFLPLKIEKTVYDSFALTVYIDRERTGFEDSKDFPIVLGSLIAGRYRVMEFLGAASFAKCVHVKDLKKNIHCCLKIIENNKDFIDQSVDEIKLLR